MMNCLLLGRNENLVENVKNNIDVKDVNLFGGTNLQDVKDTFHRHDIDIVIMGAGLEMKDRLEIVRFIFEKSSSTTVHMKDWDSGPGGLLPFANGILDGLN